MINYCSFYFYMITLYVKLKILETVIVTSCKSNKSGYNVSEKGKSYLRAGIWQNRLSGSTVHIKFDVDLNLECGKNIFGRKHRVLAFTTTHQLL